MSLVSGIQAADFAAASSHPGAAERKSVARPKLDFVQALRAVAALLVVCSHIGKEAGHWFHVPDGRVVSFLENGAFGVDLFFIISGFIMYIVMHERYQGPRAAMIFVAHRILRIVPVYWLYTTLYLGAALFAGELVRRKGMSVAYVIASYLFFPHLRPGTDSFAPVFVGGWTLNFEMEFYLFCTILILFSVRHLATALVGILLAVALIGALLIDQGHGALWYWSRAIVLEFGLGVIIAALFKKQAIRLPLPASLAILATGVILWQVSDALLDVQPLAQNIRAGTWGIAAALMFASIAFCPRLTGFFEKRRGTAWLLALGDASFSLYLAHMFVVRVCTIVFLKLFGPDATVPFALVSLLCCLTVAPLTFRYIEAPFMAFAKRRLPL